MSTYANTGEVARARAMLMATLTAMATAMVREHFSTANRLTVQLKSRFWQRHGIGFDVRHAVKLPESAISLQKESNSLRKGVDKRKKWGLAEMVLWSVRGRSRFSGFFCCLIL